MITLYNSLSRRKEPLKSLKPKQLGMYTCGPTVYGPSHLGHARTYTSFDALRRFFETRGYRVRYVMNITDIHDDILKEARRLKTPPLTLARRYAKEFLADLTSLKIKKAYVYSRVTQHLREIIALIKKLIQAGYAYETDDGVYFRLAKFSTYGKLSGRILAKAKTGTRVRTDKYDKESVADFALWKKEDDDWLFDSPWGKGRPGWHIECSAMAAKYLGQPFDIHAGALDLLFPHHENEIAQSEGANHKKLANIFLHAGLLNVNGQKMSKSLGNYISLPDFLTTHSPRFLRFFILSHHWRAPIDLTDKNLIEAKANFTKINEFVVKLSAFSFQLRQLPRTRGGETKEVTMFVNKFNLLLDNDFNTAAAMNLLLAFINKLEYSSLHQVPSGTWLHTKQARLLLKALKIWDRFFVCFFPWHRISAKQRALIKKREQLRTAKKFKQADAIRGQLASQHLLLQDTPTGTVTVNLD